MKTEVEEENRIYFRTCAILGFTPNNRWYFVIHFTCKKKLRKKSYWGSCSPRPSSFRVSYYTVGDGGFPPWQEAAAVVGMGVT